MSVFGRYVIQQVRLYTSKNKIPIELSKVNQILFLPHPLRVDINVFSCDNSETLEAKKFLTDSLKIQKSSKKSGGFDRIVEILSTWYLQASPYNI
ncbi:hypothetical protein CHUV2995_01912 [Corynebacterium diphtheriae subsp. lausannense]|nr:hypothetical protein BUE64_02205 [Corynebacterium diphtheriae subsp. lausannense]SPJ41101.1 hypothetical protein CHUV2995_01912 [Corynebacterium diphtheriae subsp. lausannense]